MDAWKDAFLKASASIRSPKTVQTYDTATRKFREFLERWEKSLEALPPNAVAAFTIYLSKSGVSPSSVRTYVSAIKSFLTFCRENGLDIPQQHQPKYPRKHRKVPIVLRERTLATYMEVAKTTSEPYKTALLLFPLTGLRVSEMCGLKLDDIVIEPPWVRLHVRWSKSKDDRVVPMLKQGKPILWRYLKYVRPKLKGDIWLFPNQNGDPIRPRSLQDQMRKVRVQLGIPNMTPHTLRHTYLTILNENGITGLDLAEIAGHQSLNTSRIYVHPSEERLSQQVNNINLSGLPDTDDESEDE